jgi:DNA-binding winged helix-turn-helix (wHTH) protein
MSTLRRVLRLSHGRRVDLDAGTISGDGEARALTTTEARLLGALADRPGEAVSSEDLLREVWGRTWSGDPDELGVVRNTMFKLRKKVERDPAQPAHITTAQGDGYRLVLDELPTTHLATPVGPPGEPYQAASFVGRRALVEAVSDHLASAPQPLVLQGPWRSGKSWVLARALRQLVDRGMAVARLDPRSVDRASLADPERLVGVLADELIDTVGLDPDALPSGGTPYQRLKRLVERHVLPRAPDGLVLAVEDVDRLARVPAQIDLLAMLRGWTEETRPIWERFRLVLTSATPPVLLTARLQLSPFNLGRTLHMPDLEREDVEALAAAAGLPEAAAAVYAQVGGHVWLARGGLFGLASGAADPWAWVLDELAARVAAAPGGVDGWRRLTGAPPAWPTEPALSELLRLGLIQTSAPTPCVARPLFERLAARLPAGGA